MAHMGSLKMKAIVIFFADQCPKHIEHIKAFIHNWARSLAIIVMMPNPRKSYAMETSMQINEKIDVQLGTFSARNLLFQ